MLFRQSHFGEFWCSEIRRFDPLSNTCIYVFLFNIFTNASTLADGIVRQDNFECARFFVRLSSSTWIEKYWISQKFKNLNAIKIFIKFLNLLTIFQFYELCFEKRKIKQISWIDNPIILPSFREYQPNCLFRHVIRETAKPTPLVLILSWFVYDKMADDSKATREYFYNKLSIFVTN